MGKGKTHRKRVSSKRKSKNIYLDADLDIINLSKWIKRARYDVCKSIKLVEFPDTGRGVMALENISANDTLMMVPCEAILSPLTVENDCCFKKLFFPVKFTVCLMLSCQELLAFYIVYLKLQVVNSSYWLPYIKVLPTDFTLPYFLDINDIQYLDQSVIERTVLQRKKILSSYSRLCDHIIRLCKHNENLMQFCRRFSIQLYAWAYFIVNTRCVYLDPMLIKEACSRLASEETVNCLSIISDEPNLGLVPYLDMFNHSTEVTTSAKLRKMSDFHNGNCNNSLYSDNFIKQSDLVFELKTLTSFRRYDQIFISYGEHCNLKLFTEYGFIIPQNPLSTLRINFEEICHLVKTSELKHCLSNDKYKFIKKHEIDRNVNISNGGYSYNFLRFLYLLMNDNKKLWNMKVFSSDFSKEELEKMYNAGEIILKNKREDLDNKITKFSCESCSNIFRVMCIELMKEFICLIDNTLRKY